jgi:two-component system invasion response regulator UvrY
MTDRIKVLIVDDIPETRDHLSKLLGFEGDVEVVGAAAGGPEAIEMATALRPDVVLMDINMPGMGGIEATRRIREDFPETVVFLCSTYELDDLPPGAATSGATAYVNKEELGPAVLRRLWDGRETTGGGLATV